MEHAPTKTARPRAQLRAGALRVLCVLGVLLAICATGTVAQAGAALVPTAKTDAASAVTYSTATLNGTVNPHGEATEYFFQYGTTSKFGSDTPPQPAGSGKATVNVNEAISGLAAFTTYHFRLVAISPAGASTGAEAIFKTPKIPLTVAIAGVPDPVTYGGSYTVEGTLSGTGAADQEIELQGNPFPYLAGFQQLGNAELSSAVGSFSFPVLDALANTQLRALAVATPTAISPPLVEEVAVKVTLHAHATARRGYARLYGTVEPAEVGALVGFQLLKTGHRSKNVGGSVVKALSASSSRFSRVLRVKRGLYEALVVVNDGAHVSNTSLPVLIR
jgi:hypothetical protein